MEDAVSFLKNMWCDMRLWRRSICLILEITSANENGSGSPDSAVSDVEINSSDAESTSRISRRHLDRGWRIALFRNRQAYSRTTGTRRSGKDQRRLLLPRGRNPDGRRGRVLHHQPDAVPGPRGRRLKGAGIEFMTAPTAGAGRSADSQRRHPMNGIRVLKKPLRRI